MKNVIKENRQTLKELFDAVSVTNSKGIIIRLDDALEEAINMIIEQTKSGKKLLFIGNGGSASIASHIATDFLKNAKIASIAFNDSPLLTCISNDCGYEYVFEKPIEILANSGDILFAISSSGKSENILRGAGIAKEKELRVITLSGFDNDNPLRRLGDINFYVPSSGYGHVEIMHLSICHSLVDVIVEKRKKEWINTK